jgi:hypothetical protein
MLRESAHDHLSKRWLTLCMHVLMWSRRHWFTAWVVDAVATANAVFPACLFPVTSIALAAYFLMVRHLCSCFLLFTLLACFLVVMLVVLCLLRRAANRCSAFGGCGN